MTSREYNSAKCYTAILLKIYEKEIALKKGEREPILENLLIKLEKVARTIKIKKHYYFFVLLVLS